MEAVTISGRQHTSEQVTEALSPESKMWQAALRVVEGRVSECRQAAKQKRSYATVDLLAQAASLELRADEGELLLEMIRDALRFAGGRLVNEVVPEQAHSQGKEDQRNGTANSGTSLEVALGVPRDAVASRMGQSGDRAPKRNGWIRDTMPHVREP